MNAKNIALIRSDAPPPELPRPLSPARQALASARKARAAALSILESATVAQQRAERLLAAPAPLKAQLAVLERAAAGIIEAWARNGTAGTPNLPGGDDLDGLRREIIEAERVAEAARAAMPALSRDIAAAQSEAQSALGRIREAVAAVLVEEDANAKAAELTEVERRAATLRGDLRALQYHLQLDAARGNRGAAALQDVVRKKVPERVGPTDSEIQRTASKWASYAERLLENETATFSNL